MKFKISRKTVVRIVSWALIALLAPFAIELVFMADIVGAEAALAILFLYGKSLTTMLRERISLARNIIRSIVNAPPDTDHYYRKVYAFGSVAGLVLFWITGSLIISATAWLPTLFVVGRQL